MKGKIICELFSYANSPHLQQLYTGFGILHRKGVIQLIERICKEDLRAYLKVVVNRDLSLYYDVHDSFEINTEALKEVDFYFKRSYSDEQIYKLNNKEKIFSLGLNYPVYSTGLDLFLIKRFLLDKGIEKLKTLARGVAIDHLIGGGKTYVPRVDCLEFHPDFNIPPKILFMVKAWDHNEANSKDKSEEIDFMNNTRAQCIRLLKKEFGVHFLGGFVHSVYSKDRFRDCLLPDNKLSQKKNYMGLLREFPICIATTGLHGSIGWKLAEYVSYSKAIVTERLKYQVPGHFERELNYLDFVSPEDCVEYAVRLFHNYSLRCQLMINNYRYYHSYLRPDSLVLNTLAIAMGSI